MTSPRGGVATGTGVLAGLVWFVVLCGADIARWRDMEMTGQVPWVWLVAALAVTAAVAWALIRWVRGFAVGVAVALAGSMLVGLANGGLAEAASGTLAVPGVFRVGAASVAVWTALGLAIAAVVHHFRAAAPQQRATRAPRTPARAR